MKKQIWAAVAVMTAFGIPLQARSAVSPEDAAKLKTELTPLGAEKAGNKDGSIPAWTGGYDTDCGGQAGWAARRSVQGRGNPWFRSPRRTWSSTQTSLTDGTRGHAEEVPDTYRVDVYKTHRTAAAPQWVYDNTFKNATRAKLVGDKVEGAYGGVPFPFRKSGPR